MAFSTPIVATALLGSAILANAALQPFEMPWDDASPGITNLQGWQEPVTTSDAWVHVTPEGHYDFDGSRIRFLGVNIAAASAMPTHDRATAHAARLARFGFNAVRMHHLEAPWDKDNVIIDYSTGTSRSLAADRLDKLQFFVAQLADHGIRTDLNLLVSREFQAGDGLGPEITQLDWKSQHVIGFFNDTALALHKEYATEILTAPNPYRGGVPLGMDPAVAFVEVMNENGLMQNWFGGLLDSMPQVYRDQLQARWNTWLAVRYADTAALLTAWGAVDEPLGANLLMNGDFSAGAAGWNGEQHDTAVATFTGTGDFNAQPALRINVTTAGTASWHVQVNQAPLGLSADGYYTISFWAKADKAVPLYASLGRAYDDYGSIGTVVNTTLDTTWRQYTVAFQNGVAESNARMNFGGFGDRVCTVWLADVRVQPGGKIGGLPDGATLEAAIVPSLRHDSGGEGQTLAQRKDWTRFIFALETDYWTAMRDHIKDTLGYPGIVWGTIISNSPPNVQSVFDAIDSHSYWQHPTWPPGQDWDPETWTVQNASMVNNLNAGTLGGLARQRVKGKPHNVTEYQHASPNEYVAEGPLLVSAYGGLQDWDGIWMFAYETTTAEAVTGFFDEGTHPGRMANNILAAALFRRGDVAPALDEFTMKFDPETEINTASTSGGAWSIADGSHLGVPATLALRSRVNLDAGADAAGLTSPPAAPSGLAITSDTGELRWDNSQFQKGVVTIDTPQTKAVVGFTNGRSWNLGGVRITPGASSLDWSTIGVTLFSGDAFDGSGGARGVIVATSRIENTGQIWKDGSHTSLGSNWGGAPVLIEPVTGSVSIPVAAGRVSAWALDAEGQRAIALGVVDDGGNARIDLGTGPATLWYEFEIVALAAPVVTTQPKSHSIAVNGTVQFHVDVSGYPGPTFQWQVSTDGGANWSNVVEGGNLADATTATLEVIKPVVGMNGNRFRAVVTNSEGTTTSDAGVLNVAATAGPRLINVSCLAAAGTGGNTLVMGFYISGTGSKTLVIRGVGPGMAKYFSGELVPDPSITLFRGTTAIASNDDWDPALETAFGNVGAFPLQTGSTDAALRVDLAPGLYTVHLVNSAPAGEGLIEVYDLSRDLGTWLSNVSCRLNLKANQLVILGTALIDGSKTLLARNVGPGLTDYVLNPDALLSDPHLRIYAGQTEIGVNDDWDDATGAYFGPVGAFPLESGSSDAAIRVTAPQGALTIHATGKGGSGVSLIELYESP